MKMPSTAELLVKVAREAEQRRLLETTREVDTLEELRKKLQELINLSN